MKVVIKMISSISIAGSAVSRAHWEDVTKATPIAVKSNDTLVIFETRVSALFWVLAVDTLENPPGADENGKRDLEKGSIDNGTLCTTAAGHLYNELVGPPYLARIVIMHKPQARNNRACGF